MHKLRLRMDYFVCFGHCVFQNLGWCACLLFLLFQSVSLICPHRFKPLQKVDSMSDSLCGGPQACNSTPEQSVAAQSQHHQHYIGKVKTSVPPFLSVPLRAAPGCSFCLCRYVSHPASVSPSGRGLPASTWAHQHEWHQEAENTVQRPLWGGFSTLQLFYF